MSNTATKSEKRGKGRKAAVASKRGRKPAKPKASKPAGTRSKKGNSGSRLRPGQLDGFVLGYMKEAQGRAARHRDEGRAGNQTLLAERADLDRTEIGLLERGRRVPRLDTVIKLGGAVEVRPCVLLEGMVWDLDRPKGESS